MALDYNNPEFLAFLQSVGLTPDPETTGSIPIAAPPTLPIEEARIIPAPEAVIARDVPQAPAPALVAPAPAPQAHSIAPVQIASAEDVPPMPRRPMGAIPTAPASSQGGFLGINNADDFGRRLQNAAAWIAPAGSATAAAGFLAQRDKVAQDGIDNARADQHMALKREEFGLEKQKVAALLQSRTAPDVRVSTSENGHFRVIQKTNPLTGEVSFDRQAIPADEQEKKYPKAPANLDKIFNEDETATVKTIALMRDGEEIRNMFRDGQIDMSLVGRGEAELKTLADSGDQRAANAMRLRSYLQGSINNILRGEKGVQTDSDAKRIAGEVLAGNASLNNTQMYQWLGRYMETLNGDVKYRTGRSINTLKRYGPDYDPDEYRSTTFREYGERGRSYYESDLKRDKDKPYDGRGSQPTRPTVTSPIMEDLRRRGVIR